MASGSIGLSLPYSIRKVGSAGNPTIRVPKYRKSPAEVVEWMEVPRQWFEQHHRAKTALKQFNEEHFHKQGLHETGLVAVEKQYGGKRGFKIEVFVDPEKFSGKLPEEQNNVRISVEERPEETNYLCYNIGTYYEVPGGVNFFDKPTNGPLSTTGYPLRDSSTNEEFMLGAAHAFGICSVTDGDDTFTLDKQVGRVSRGSVSLDFVLSDFSGADSDPDVVRAENKIYGESGESWPIFAYADEQEIADRVSSWFDGYSSMGCTTGRTTGGLGKKNITTDTCHDFNGEGVRGSANAAEGDSGGPCFDIGGDKAKLLYHVSRGTPNTKIGEIYQDCTGGYAEEYAKHEGPGAYAVFNRGYEIITESFS